MEFFETIHKRRSIRKFKPEIFPDALVQKALAAAILAPNSSNTQTWDFHWVKTTEKKQKLIEYCLSQSAARTATQLLVVTANPTRWKRSQKPLIEWVKKANAPKMVQIYYEKLIPITYRWGFLNSLAIIRAIGFFITGLFRPIMRGPLGKRQLQEVAIKSAARLA
jgi:nitroreductase